MFLFIKILVNTFLDYIAKSTIG